MKHLVRMAALFYTPKTVYKSIKQRLCFSYFVKATTLKELLDRERKPIKNF